MNRYFERVAGVGNGYHIYVWKSKGLSYENITAPTTTDYSLNQKLTYFGTKTRVEFSRCCLKQDKTTCYKLQNYTWNIVNICIVYEISKITT